MNLANKSNPDSLLITKVSDSHRQLPCAIVLLFYLTLASSWSTATMAQGVQNIPVERVMFENFSRFPYLDTAKWVPQSLPFADGVQRIQRRIRNERLNLALAATTKFETRDRDSLQTRTNRITARGNKLNGMFGFDGEVRVNLSTHGNCRAVTGREPHAIATYRIAAFNDGRSANENDHTGDHFLEVTISGSASGSGSVVYPKVYIWRNRTARLTQARDGNARILQAVFSQIRRPNKIDDTYRFTMELFPRFKRISYQLYNVTRNRIAISGRFKTFGNTQMKPIPAKRLFVDAEVSTQTPSCRREDQLVRISAEVDASFDNIHIHRIIR